MSFLSFKVLGSGSPAMCENCGMQPKYGGYDYCGKTCAAEGERKKKAGGGRGAGPGRGAGATTPGFGRTNFSSASGSYSSVAAGPNYGFDSGMCENCGIRPKNQDRQPDGRTVVHPYCGRNCADTAARQKASTQQQQYGQAAGPASPVTRVTLMDSQSPLSKHIYEKFRARWEEDKVQQPVVMGIYRIQLPVKYYNRFDGALEMNEGATVTTTYYGGQSICEIGCNGEQEGTPCNWESCSICLVLRTAFATLEFGADAYEGIYGPGIYTHEYPSMAHRWTLAKNPEITPCRAIIQCRVVQAGIDNRSQANAAFTDDTGRTFCKEKRAIIPTYLIIYNPGPPPAPERRPRKERQ